MRIAFYGDTGQSPYYRGIIRNLTALGHHITQHNLEQTRNADVVINAIGEGTPLEQEILAGRLSHQTMILWDVDPLATLGRLQTNSADPMRRLIPQYDIVFTAGGGDPVVWRYKSFGARECIPIHLALDPLTHHPVGPRAELAADLAFAGDRMAGEETRVEELFFRPASLVPASRFLLAGAGWQDRTMPASVVYAGDAAASDHNAIHCSARAVLNVTRETMVVNGWSPEARLFEAAGAAACVITDEWEGLDFFLDPGVEVLVARDATAVAELIRTLDPRRARAIGKAALRRVLAQHTYAHRAVQVDGILNARTSAPRRVTRGATRYAPLR